MKGSTDKYQLLLSKNDETRLELGDSLIKNITFEKVLGVKLNNKLIFDFREITNGERWREIFYKWTLGSGKTTLVS